MRGMSIPLVVDFTSRIELASGAELSVLMLTPCAKLLVNGVNKRIMQKAIKRKVFMSRVVSDDRN